MISIENRARLAFALVLFVGVVVWGVWHVHTASQYNTYQIVTHDSVSGLLVEAPVEFHGVEVGKVRSIQLTDPHSVSILLRLRKELPITTTTVATITARGLATRGFTGYVYISLDDPGIGSPALLAEKGNDYPRIRVAPPRSLNLDSAISQLNANVQYMTDLLRSVLDKETIVSLKRTAGNLQKVTRMLAENNKRLDAIISNTEQASTQFRPLLQSSREAINTLQFQILPETYRTLDKLDRLSDSLNGVANKIDRDPSVLLRGSASPPPGPGEIK